MFEGYVLRNAVPVEVHGSVHVILHNNRCTFAGISSYRRFSTVKHLGLRALQSCTVRCSQGGWDLELSGEHLILIAGWLFS